jgi:hypothetical protein
MKKIFFASLKSLKKWVGSGVGSGSEVRSGAGSISQRYGSENPDPHQNVTDPQHCPQKTLVLPPLHNDKLSCIRSGAGSISYRYGSADPDPDPQHCPQHWFYSHCIMTNCTELMLGKTVLNLHGVGFVSGDRSGAGFICQRYGSADSDLYPHQNVTDPTHSPQHWFYRHCINAY